MNKQKPDIDALLQELVQRIPTNLGYLSQDIQDSMKDALEIGLAKMELVTRHEFDIQKSVLLRTREKLEALEKQVAELEASLMKK